jgi:hypothetical protein
MRKGMKRKQRKKQENIMAYRRVKQKRKYQIISNI